MLTLLREFPPCEGVVWGCYAEASQAAHRRMAFIADTGAEQRWRGTGAWARSRLGRRVAS